MFKTRIIQTLLACLAAGASAKTWYVSPGGGGTKDGSGKDNALAGPDAGIAKAVAGDTVLLIAGIYALSATVKLTASGTASARINLFAEDAATKRAYFDFSAQSAGSANRGMIITGDFWHIRGIDVYKAGDNGILFQGGSNNILEFANVHENQDAGVQLAAGAADNLILNTDSWWNYDAATLGGNADGFAPKLDVGSGNTFRGCRSWGNSDDGWDGYLRNGTTAYSASTILEDCWTFDNGYYHGDPKSPLNSRADMNGNGFKLGGGDKAGSISNGYGTQHHFVLRRCLAFDNYANGFDQNNNRGSMTLYNCTGMDNGTDFQINGMISSSPTPDNGIAPGNAVIVKNCVSTGTGSIKLTAAIEGHNSWTSGFGVSSADFLSVDSAGLRAARKPDGSLPDIAFLHLRPGSKLVNAGAALPGIVFNGSAPDLGAFETSASVGSERDIRVFRSRLRVVADSAGIVSVSGDLQTTAHVSVTIYGAAGAIQRTFDLGLWLPGEALRLLDLSGLAHGVHVVRARSDVGLEDSRRILVP